jgi:S1-C subfamily serine protease
MQIVLKEPVGEELSAFGVGYDAGGVALTIVPENSDAYKLGFRSGDLIQEINGTRISTIRKLLQYTSAQTKKSQKQLVLVIRNQAKLTIRIKEILPPVQY